MAVVLRVYGIPRLQDLWWRGALVQLREPSAETVVFALEIALGLLIPVLLLLFRRVREERERLLGVAVLVIKGFVLYHLNISITGLEYSAQVHYFPKWTEVVVTLSIVGTGFVCFALAARNLRVFEAD
jgi:Ni/Fe-hydrogenase subunit HybB-like protein